MQALHTNALDRVLVHVTPSSRSACWVVRHLLHRAHRTPSPAAALVSPTPMPMFLLLFLQGAVLDSQQNLEPGHRKCASRSEYKHKVAVAQRVQSDLVAEMPKN